MSATCISSSYFSEPSRVPSFRTLNYENRFLDPTKSDGSCGVKVVDSKSCRQLYLRSAYTFSRDDDKEKEKGRNVKDRAKKCWGRVKERVSVVYRRSGGRSYRIMRSYNCGRNKGVLVVRKVKELSCASFMSMLRKMLSCPVKG